MSKEVRGDPRGFIARVEAAREGRQLGVYEFSEAIGQAGSYWSSWINRHRERETFPRGDTLAAMADVLGVPMATLLGTDRLVAERAAPSLSDAAMLLRLGAEPATPDEALLIEEFTGSARTGRGCTTWGRLEDLERQAEAWLFGLPDPRATVLLPDDPRPREDWEGQRRRVLQLYRDGLMSEGEYQRERAALARHAARLPVAAGRRETVGLGLARARADWPTWDEVARNALYREFLSCFRVDCGTLTPSWRPQMVGLFDSGGKDAGGELDAWDARD